MSLERLDRYGMYCQCKYMSQKEDRLQIRVEEATKRILEDAAGAANMSLSAFVLQAAVRQAEDFVAERVLIRLSPSGASAFAEALARPAEVNARLAEALSRPRKFAWLD